jgi:hypothetical protein
MQSFQLIEQIQSLIEVLESQENKEFTDFLNVLNNHREMLNLSGLNIINTHNDANSLNRLLVECRKNIPTAIEEIKRSLRNGLVFAAIIRLRNIFNEFSSASNKQEEPFKNVIFQLDSFENVYEEFREDFSYHSTVKLINTGTDLINSLNSIKDIVNFTLINLQDNCGNENSSLETLSLLLETRLEYRDFLAKLESIQNIYSNLCSIFVIDEEESPLKIVKIESGSLFVKILGDSSIIAVMATTIAGFAQFAYRNYTQEGKLHQKKELIALTMQLRADFQKAGMPVDDLDNKINQSALYLCEQVNCLILGESKFKINGEIIKVIVYQDLKVKQNS